VLRSTLRNIWDDSVYCSVSAEPISLDELITESVAGRGRSSQFDIPSYGPNPSDDLDSKVSLAAIADFVCGLPKREREIATAVFWGGTSQAEVARRLGVSKMAISKSVSKILKLGRCKLADYHDFAVNIGSEQLLAPGCRKI
jgi:RNA polymerase sigma factor (sigma-70 family)